MILPILPIVLGVLAVHACGQESASNADTDVDTKVAAKLDAELATAQGRVAIFVRMTDQLLPRAGAFEAWAQAHAGAKRSTTRREVIAELQRRRDAASEALRDEIEKQTKRGGLRDVTPFFVVNGFAAAADAQACRAFAARDDVAFVHLQRGPAGLTQHRTRRGAEPIGTKGELETALASAAKGRDAFASEGSTIPWNLGRVQADAAWALGATGAGVVVAVLDTGLLPVEPVTRALWRNPGETLNGKDDDGNGYVDDVVGFDFAAQSGLVVGSGAEPHGTMCAGIVAGRPAGEPRTVTGVAPQASLMVLRGGGLLHAYEYALLEGADVLSMSYMWIDVDVGSFRGVFRTAHEHLAAAGVLSLGGAGNFGRSHPDGRQIATPKDIPCVLAVAGIVENDSVPPFSSRGPVTWDVPFFDDHPATRPLLKPDLTACNGGFPVWGKLGGQRSTTLQRLDDAHGLVVGPRGNSFAGPHVAGVAALIWSVAPELQSFEVAEILRKTARDLGPEGPDATFGHGLTDAEAAVRTARTRGGSGR